MNVRVEVPGKHVPGPQAVLAHRHVFWMDGEFIEHQHTHQVDLLEPAHIHRLNRASSYGRFVLEHLEGARRAAGIPA